jgi:glutathione S-transferase/putative methionine-R-sulfoxide reductase with GAF domain
MTKAATYQAIFDSLKAKLADQDFPAKQKMLSQEISAKFDRFNFVGYYDVKIKPEGNGALHLTIGEYVSKDVIPCGEIEMGKGQCGMCAEKGKNFIVKDTAHVKNYIACDQETKSEICVPCFSEDGRVVAVLDLDGLDAGAFDKEDADWLDRCNRLIYAGTGFKIYNNFTGNVHTNSVLVAASMAGCLDIHEVQMSVPDRKKPENIEKTRLSASPALETKDGVLNDSSAIMRYIARKFGSDIAGANPFEMAKVDEWTGFAQSQVWPNALKHIFAVFGWDPAADAQQKHGQFGKAIKEVAKTANDFLEGKQFFVNDRITLADIHLFGYFEFCFQVSFDEGFRKSIPHLTAWFERVAADKHVAGIYGKIFLCSKAVKAFAPKGGFVFKPSTSHIIYVNYKFNLLMNSVMVAANAVGFKDVTVVVMSDEQRKNADHLKKFRTTATPQLECPEGCLTESTAIAKYFARMDSSKGLLGQNSLEEAQIDQWLMFAQTELFKVFGNAIAPIFGWRPIDPKDHQEGVKGLKDIAKSVNAKLEGKKYLVGEKITLADYILAAGLMMPFQLLFEVNYRKSIPHITAWFERVAADEHFISRFGKVHMAAKQQKAQAPPKN